MGYYFSTYAVVVIRHFIQKKVCEFYHVSPTIFSDFMRAMKVVEANYERKYKIGDTEMLEDILDLLVNINCISHWSKEGYLRMFDSYKPLISIEEEGENIYSDVDITSLASFDSLRSDLMRSLDTLTDRENKVLRLRWGLETGESMTFEQVGRYFDVSKERIRQIEAKALRKMRHPSRSKRLKPYLDDVITDEMYGEATDLEKNPSEDYSDTYYDSEQDSMENPSYKDALEELDELYREESRKTR